MTNTRSIFRIRVLAALSAIVMLVVALFGFGVAKADSAGGGDSAPDSWRKRPLLYISDYDGGASVANSLLRSGYVTGLDYRQCPDGMTFLDFIDSVRESDTFESISNYCVIVEMNKRFPMQIDNNDLRLLTTAFGEMFSALKSRGCYIMFINGTDESSFVNHRAFLDDVDIHINTDMLYTFIQNIFYRAIVDCGLDYLSGDLKIHDCTFILDKSVADGSSEASVVSTWFIRNYFITFIRHAYYDDLFGTEMTVAALLNEHAHISVLCHVDGDIYYDLFKLQSVRLDFYNSNEYLVDRHVYAVGITWATEQYTKSWITKMSVLSNYDLLTGEYSFPVFVYNSAAYDLYEYGSYLHVINNAYIPVIHSAIIDFVNGAPLDSYNNYDGRCEVSCKAVPGGSDGWLLLFGDDGDWFFIPGWQVIMTQDEYDYYYSTDGIF